MLVWCLYCCFIWGLNKSPLHLSVSRRVWQKWLPGVYCSWSSYLSDEFPGFPPVHCATDASSFLQRVLPASGMLSCSCRRKSCLCGLPRRPDFITSAWVSFVCVIVCARACGGGGGGVEVWAQVRDIKAQLWTEDAMRTCCCCCRDRSHKMGNWIINHGLSSFILVSCWSSDLWGVHL